MIPTLEHRNLPRDTIEKTEKSQFQWKFISVIGENNELS